MAVSPATLSAPWYQAHTGATAFTRGEAQKFARLLVENNVYRENLKKAMIDRTVSPAIEAMVWYYAYGKPTEQINLNLSTQEDLSALSISDLQKRAREIAQELEEAEAVNSAIPTEFQVA